MKKRYENIHGPLDQETHLIWNELLKYKEDPTKPLDSEEICRICMISDENQFDYALNSLFNISKRSSNPIESYLIVDKSNNKYEQKVKVINNYFEEHFKGKHTINLVDSSKKRIEIFESKIAHITWVTNLRIFITNILDKVEGKILYLDNDTYVDGDVSEIFRFAKNKRGHYGQQWSPKEPWPKKLSEITGKIINKYFNAGVLILDMDLLREMEFVKEATDFYRNFNPLIRYADQDILNSLLLINEFPSEFNIGRTKWVKQRRDLEGFYNLKIYHFLSYSKTWDTDEFNIKMIKQKESKGTLTLEEYEKFRPAREKWINEYNDYLSILKNKLPDSYKDSDYSISFLLTLFKPTDEQIMKWEDYEKKLIKLGIDLIILVDNPGLNLNNKFTKSKIYYNSENIGKFETVYNFIKNNEIKSTHIKVCDPDDNIIFEELEKFKINFPGILLLLNRINNNGCIDFKKQNSLGTGWTVIPVNPIKKDRFYIESDFKIRNWLEDQALGIICYINGAKFKRSNIGWYEYVLNLGMTKKIEEKDAKEIVETLDSLKKILNLSNEKPKTNFPGRLWYILNLIKHSDMSPNKKRNYREKIEEYIIYDGVEEIDCE